MVIKVEVFDDCYSINGMEFTSAPLLEVALKQFGNYRLTKPQSEASKSDIYTFDDAGVWIYAKDNKVSQISLLLSDSYLEIHPQKPYSGVVKIKGRSISNSDDFSSIECDEIYLDEWDDEGAISMALKRVCLNITADNETKNIKDVSFWFGPPR